jgi:hypothetical protein
MTEYCGQFKKMMDNFRTGIYGEWLYLSQIEEKAGLVGLCKKLDLEDLEELRKTHYISNMMCYYATQAVKNRSIATA